MGDGTLVSNQETKSGHRPADNPVVNHLSLVYVRASEESSRTVAHVAPGSNKSVVFWANRTVGVPSYPVPPRPAAPPCAAPPRPACGMSWFWIRPVMHCAFGNLTDPKLGHNFGRGRGRDWAGMVQARPGWAGRGADLRDYASTARPLVFQPPKT